MKKTLILIISFSFSFLVFSQKQSVDLKETNKDYYKWISFLSEGEINWFDDIINNVEGEAFRFVITSSDIYNQIFIERISFGPEGCCRQVDLKKEVPIDKIFTTFNITGERSGVQFIQWKSPTSIEILINNKKYLIENIDKDKVLIYKL